MKVLQINSVCGVGSTGRIATDLYKVLESQGHECIIAYGRGTAPEGIKTIKIGTNLDNYTHVANTRILDRHGFGSKLSTEKLIKAIEEYNPDIIHLHNIHGYYVNIEVLFNYLNASNIPVVWTLHDCWSFTGHCAYFDFVGCEKWKEQCSNCIQKKSYPVSIVKDNSLKNYKDKKKLFSNNNNLHIVTVSNWLKETVEQSFLKNHNISVICNGIDLNIFKPLNNTKSFLKEELENKKIILGVANVWEERKGLNDFIKLSKRLEDDYRIVLVGLNSQQIKNLPSNIIGLSRTNSMEELVQLYSKALVFVNASVEETFGLVTVEAMACGTPAIVYNTTASPELIEDGCGYVVAKNDIDAVIERINEINTKGKKYYSDNCRSIVEEKYNKNEKYNEYIFLYERILSKTK